MLTYFRVLARFEGFLSHLELSDNKIHSIPEEIPGMESLSTLDLSNNEIRRVGFGICYLPRLTTLNLYGNPQRSISQRLLSAGTEAVLEYLAKKIPQN